jgi:hypothetical protein
MLNINIANTELPFTILEPISIMDECHKALPQKIELISYYVTEYPRFEDPLNNSSFVYGLFEQPRLAFGSNQDEVLYSAGEMFQNAEALTAFENDTLNETFLRLAKRKPTRPNRI